MKPAFATHRTIVSAIGAAAIVAGGFAGFGPGNSAHAEGDRLGNFEIQRLMASASDTSSQQVMEIGGLKWEMDVVELNAQFEIQTKTSDLQNAESPSAGKDGAKGGNVEFEWKVEEGES